MDKYFELKTLIRRNNSKNILILTQHVAQTKHVIGKHDNVDIISIYESIMGKGFDLIILFDIHLSNWKEINKFLEEFETSKLTRLREKGEMIIL